MRTPKIGYLTSAAQVEHLPTLPYPEIAFTGRSNVGKSSLLNTLVFQRRLAHVSSVPGKTRTINLYPVDGKWILVDLPGYGYAKLSRAQRQNIQQLIYDYLFKREQLILTLILVDSRHDPTEADLALIEQLELRYRRYAVILTKVDLLEESAIEERIQQLCGLTSQCVYCSGVIPTSARTGFGRQQLWSLITKSMKAFHHSHLNSCRSKSH